MKSKQSYNPGNVDASPMYSSGITKFTSGAGIISLANLQPINFQSFRPFTIETWIYLDVLVDQMTIISCPSEFYLQTQGANLQAYFAHEPNVLQANNVLKERTWYHVAVTADGMIMKLYLNGVPIVQMDYLDQGAPTTGNPIQIGGNFYGQIASCRLWHGAVIPSYIAAYQWYDYPSGTTDLLAQMDFTCLPAVDSSGNKVTAAFSASGVNFFSCIPATHFQGNGFASPYNDQDQAINPGGTATDFTVMGWVNPEYLISDMFIFANGPLESDSGMTLYMNSNGNVCFQVGNSPVLSSVNVVTTGQWYHIAVTWSAAANTGIIYIDGSQDNTANNMSLASTSYGAPLLGAIASQVSALPISTFQGYIQGISIWNTALNSNDVVKFMSQDPQNEPNCIADYNLSIFPVQNVSNFNPVGLVWDAQLKIIEQQVTNDYKNINRPVKVKEEFAQQDTAVVSGTWLPDELQNKARDTFQAFLEQTKLEDDAKKEIIERFNENLQKSLYHLANDKYEGLSNIKILELENGKTQLLLIEQGQTEIVYEGTLDACTLWTIALIAAIVGALSAAFGFVVNYSKWLKGFTTFLEPRINTIGLTPQLVRIFKNGVTPNGIYDALKLLHEFSLLMPLLNLSWELLSSSVGFWTVLSVGARVLLIMSPAAPLEISWLMAELAHSLYSVIGVINKRPPNCPS